MTICEQDSAADSPIRAAYDQPLLHDLGPISVGAGKSGEKHHEEKHREEKHHEEKHREEKRGSERR